MLDPRTGEAMNPNFHVHFADRRVAAMVHTVQVYGLEDAAHTYGNEDFSEMHDFLWWQVRSHIQK